MFCQLIPSQDVVFDSSCYLQAKGVKDFPQNFIIVNMLDFVAVKNSDKKPILCSSCNEQLPATARCIDCMDFLCYACHSAHGRVRITKDHQVITSRF